MNFADVFPENLTLQSNRVLLRALRESDLEHLLPISRSRDIFTYFTLDLSEEGELRQWVSEGIEDRKQGKRFPFCIVEKSTGKVCGSTSLGSISFYDKRIEIGWSWVGEEFMGTGINTHAKFLLLQFAFDTLNFIRVEIKTDNLNARAKKALVKIGAQPEGVLRSHMQMFNNRRRDSIYYSILQHEWPTIRQTVFAGLR